MKKKLLLKLLLCTFLVCVSALCITACDSDANGDNNPNNPFNSVVADVTIDGLNYHIEDGAATVTGAENKGTLTTITIPEDITYNEVAYLVTSIDKNAFYNCKSLVNVLISNNVTTIGDHAFSGCSSIKNMSIPDSLTNIGYEAFSDFNDLFYYKKDGLEYLGNPNNKYLYLADVTLNEITQATIDTNCKFIGDYAFSSCRYLIDINIPVGVTSIGYQAFYNCESLTNVIIPNSVKSIGDYAFFDCDSLISISISESVTTIGHRAFYGRYSLTNIKVDENNSKYKSIDGNLYSKDGKTIIQYAMGKNATNFTIPNTVIKIEDFAFALCESLKTVTIQENLKDIGNRAFYGCFSLATINIPDSVTSIGDSAFEDCDSLKNITIGDGVVSIGDYAFYFSGLKSIFIGESLTSIGENIFGYTWLERITVNENNKHFKSIDGNLYTKDEKVLVKYAPYQKYISFTMPDRLIRIHSYAFSECNYLEKITIPNSVTSIGDHAFYNCTSSISITIPNSVRSIGDYAFSVTVWTSYPVSTKITFKGTVEEWKAIAKGSKWDYDILATKIICSDGEVDI